MTFSTLLLMVKCMFLHLKMIKMIKMIKMQQVLFLPGRLLLDLKLQLAQMVMILKPLGNK
jgi:hypothetical protein